MRHDTALYNGLPRWQAATDAAELVAEGPGGLSRYRPQVRYLLIDEAALPVAALPETRNLVAALFRLEHSREPEDVRRVVELLVEWLAAPEQTSLRRAFTVWLRRVLLPARLPGVVMPEVTELQEVRSLLAERVIGWTKEWKQQGLEEGRIASARESVLAALELRFGRPPTELEDAINRIEDLTKLRVLLRRAILAGSVDEFTAELDAADTHAQDPS